VTFSRILAIDFSAASVPTLGENSLWLAWREQGGPLRTTNFATRHELSIRIENLAARPGRTLIVIDVALGWPQGMAYALGVKGRRGVVALLSTLLSDDDNNRNNRFDVANELNRRSGASLWWGHPATHRYTHLSMNSAAPHELAPRPFSHMRLIERHVGGVIKSPMQLSGVGAVGSQSLMAQLLFDRLRHGGMDLSVWPFEPATTRVVVAESFFSLLDWRKESGTVRDQRQVRACVRWAERELATSDPLNEVALLSQLTALERRAVLAEEGWLMGWPSRSGVTR
jgi:hypothetical protein